MQGVSLSVGPNPAMMHCAALGEEPHLSHPATRYKIARFRRSKRLRYRIARLFVIMLPLVLVLYLLFAFAR
jgi:hypothetical protein